ncbi:hypothetical protein MUK42_20315 [Musa troglodytarum]|uniref:Uncharacterized protein n=1 Tax=Musa troglodytarum TaxID=320322 RepID=A0A9E7F6Y2_9LILI|nr:hypothetical protein MUK42_20315 [Musa troglodytarum]
MLLKSSDFLSDLTQPSTVILQLTTEGLCLSLALRNAFDNYILGHRRLFSNLLHSSCCLLGTVEAKFNSRSNLLTRRSTSLCTSAKRCSASSAERQGCASCKDSSMTQAVVVYLSSLARSD